MKLVRIFAACVLVITLLAGNVYATAFSSSPERDDPLFVETEGEDGKIIIGTIYNEDGSVYGYVYKDEMIITPIEHVYRDDIEVRKEIEETLLEVEKELKDNTWTDIIPDFAEKWEEVTGGAPLENAVLAKLFDVRLIDSLTGVLAEGRRITFSVKFKDLTEEDIFLLMQRLFDKKEWQFDKYSMKDNVLTLTITNAIAHFVVVKDSGEPPVIPPDAPDSPQTGVSAYCLPAIGGIVLFGCLAVVLGMKYKKYNAA